MGGGSRGRLCSVSRFQISGARLRPVYHVAAPGRNRFDYSEPIGWKSAGSIGYPVPRRLCQGNGADWSVRPKPANTEVQNQSAPFRWHNRQTLSAVMAAQRPATGNFIARATLNTETGGKFRGNYYILPRTPESSCRPARIATTNVAVYTGFVRGSKSVLIHKVSNQVRRCDDPHEIFPIDNGHRMKPVATEQLRGVAHSTR